MKKLITIVIGSTLGIALWQLSDKLDAQSSPHKHRVVVLHAYETGLGINNSGNYVYHYTGIDVYDSSSSEGAPTFPNYPDKTTSLAEDIAKSLDEGLHIIHASDNGMYIILGD